MNCGAYVAYAITNIINKENFKTWLKKYLKN